MMCPVDRAVRSEAMADVVTLFGIVLCTCANACLFCELTVLRIEWGNKDVGNLELSTCLFVIISVSAESSQDRLMNLPVEALGAYLRVMRGRLLAIRQVLNVLKLVRLARCFMLVGESIRIITGIVCLRKGRLRVAKCLTTVRLSFISVSSMGPVERR